MGDAMKYSMNEVNKKLEGKISVDDLKLEKQFGRIKRGDLIVYNTNNIMQALKVFEKNWMLLNNKTFIYNRNKDIKIENYIYALTMKTNIPNDLYEDVIELDTMMWENFKNIISNKPLFILNQYISSCIYNDITDVIKECGKIDIFLVIDDELNNCKLSDYYQKSCDTAMIIITNKDKYTATYSYHSLRYVGW